MKTKSVVMSLFILFILGALFSNILFAQADKIRVVVKNSSIRIEPNVQSKIIDSPPLGAVFEVIQKTGVWYQIKLSSKNHEVEDGYVHEMFIEELKAKEEPPRINKAKEIIDIGEAELESRAKEHKEQKQAQKIEPKSEKEKEQPEESEGSVSEPERDENEIKNIVNKYTEALQNKGLLLFYEQNSTPEYFTEIREDALWLTQTYDRINCCVSDVSIQSKNREIAEVNISLIITGLPRIGGDRKLLFEGIYQWRMIKQNLQWKIAEARSQDYH